MKISIYTKTYDPLDSMKTFLDFYYGLDMQFLASDLLQKGLTPKEISDAVLKAIKTGKSSGIEIRKHFMPVFTQVNSSIVNDCKLSKMGYGLVLLNANSELSSVAEWQIKVLNNFFDLA